MKKRRMVLAALLVLAVAVAVGLIRHKQASVAARQLPEAQAIVIGQSVLKFQPVRLTRPINADVAAVREAVLTSRITGYVVDLPLFEGESFRKGRLLAALDMLPVARDGAANSLDREAAAAHSALAAARERLARTRALFAKGAASLEQLQGDEAAMQAAEAQRTAAGENLSSVNLAALFDGVVSARLVSPGDLATPGKPLLKIIDPAGGLRLLVSLPQGIEPTVLTAGGRSFALVPWPEASAQGLRRFEARAAGGFVPGTHVDARVTLFDAPAAALIPRRCVMTGDGRNVTLLRLDGERAEPLSIAVAAEGEEGVASLDRRLEGVRVACASADILMRLAAGTPYRVAAAE